MGDAVAFRVTMCLCAWALLVGAAADKAVCELGDTCKVPSSAVQPKERSLSAENLLLQVSVASSHFLDVKSVSWGGEPELPIFRRPVEVPSISEAVTACAASCVYRSENHTCGARVQWVLRAENLTTALERVNRECEGQCSCGAEDFPHEDVMVEPCHTAQTGEQCYEAVEWAMTHGIRMHQERYNGLTSGSSFEEVQDWLHSNGLENCARPCDLCHTAVPGELCYQEVVATMDEGDLGLATFEDVQTRLHNTVNSSCPLPCRACHTAEPGDTCHTGVLWAMRHGIRVHPEWYPELSVNSSFEDFQEVLHAGNLERCALPCRGINATTTAPSSAITSEAAMP